MKVVINRCFGGFSLSPSAIKRMAEIEGRECYFFEHDFRTGVYTPIAGEDSRRRPLISTFDIPNPNEVLARRKDWNEMTSEERIEANALHDKHSLEARPENRADPILVRVVEELGAAANGSCAELAVVEIPDGIEWEISEYDGNERVEEVHRSWS